MSKRNGNGHANGKSAEPAPTPPLSEDEALAIANGAAISAYDFIVSRRASDDDALPAGRFWYAGGVVDDGDRAPEHLVALKAFLLDHPGVAPAAAYLFMTREVRRQRPLPWHELPLPMRQAFAVFASVLAPLVTEARREAKLAVDLEAPAYAPPPDRGVFKRIGKRGSNKALRVHMMHGQKGHVAR
jgi:hypothetical protein